jgi:hypothetical protein
MADCAHVYFIEETYEDEYVRIEYKRCLFCPATTSDTQRK